MTMLRLLALAGLGSVWVCSSGSAVTARVGCAINCADFTMRYQKKVRPFWLHIAYHGRLSDSTWQDRVLGAIRVVLQTLLRGEDVAVHSNRGTQREKSGMWRCLGHVQS